MSRKIMQHVFTLIILLSLGSAVFLGYKLVQKERDYQKGQESLERVYQVMEEVRVQQDGSSPSGSLSSPEEEVKVRELRREQYAVLNQENPDMQGWIYIKGTKIDYPVMYTPQEPEYYINHNFDKEKSSYGMIFIDGDCQLEERSQNLLLYGHHMRNGDMFAAIENYKRKDFWQKHQIIEFDTLTEKETYQVIGAFKQSAANLDESFKRMLLARNEESYGMLMDYLKTNCFYDTGVQAAWPERLITLATCEYTQQDGRFFVVAKLIPIPKEIP